MSTSRKAQGQLSMMFYSQCLLDKKGPLRTIWVAAHLDRRLKKNQVNQISITAAVDTILYSKVPIALRLSGYLLFGVVRIYSKKVNYLYQDSGETLLRIKRAFDSAHVDLSLDANMAPFHAVTLPETSEFEYMELDDLGYENTRGLDNHVSTLDQITLHERPQEFEARVWFRADDHVCGTKDTCDMFNLYEGNQRQKNCFNMESSHHKITSLEEDVLPPLPLDGPFGFDNMDFETSDSLDTGDAAPSSSNVSTRSVRSCKLTAGETQSIMEEPIEPTDISQCETLCAEQHFPSPGQTFIGTDEPDTGEESIEIGVMGKDWRTVTNIDLLEQIPLPEKGVSFTKMGPPTPLSTPKSIYGNDNVLASILESVSAMNVMSTPKTPAPQERRPRSRKRKQIVDESIFLPNEFTSQELTSTASLRRILKKVPCTSTEVWESYRLSRMGQLFLEPSVPGMSNELHKLYQRVFTGQKVKCSVHNQEEKCSVEDTFWNLKGTSKETQKNGQMKDFHKPEMKKTHAHEAMPCDTQMIPSKMDRHYELQMTGCEEWRLEAEVAGVLPSEHAAEAVTAELDSSDMMIRSPSLEVDDSGLSGEFHHVEDSTSDTEHDRGLSFLEEDSCCEDSVVRDSKKAHLHFFTNDLSTRTRAVAKYLKTTLGNLISDQQESKLSLDGVLIGRTRKEAGRMFFEILTLKSKDYIGVEQEASCASILVSAKSKLLMTIF